MSVLARFVTTTEAQVAFDSLPTSQQIPTLSPVFARVDSHRIGAEPLHIMFEGLESSLLYQTLERDIPGYSNLRDWDSPYGYGGPVGSTEVVGVRDEIQRLARERHVVAERTRLHPLNSTPYWGSTHELRPTVGYELSGEPNPLPSRVRGALKTAARHRVQVIPQDGHSIPAFAKRHSESLLRLGADPSYFYPPAYFEALEGLSYVRVLEATIDGDTVASTVLLCGPVIWEYHLAESSERGRESQAASALLAASLELAREASARTVFLGGGRSNDPDDRLLLFKRGFSNASWPYRVGEFVFDESAYSTLGNASGAKVLHYREG